MSGLADPFGRRITYLRVSVTDRCDLRCTYCMPEAMAFLPKAEVLTLEEIERLCDVFIGAGVQKIRITGGEPLVRKNMMSLMRRLGARIGNGLNELALTTNATRLSEFAGEIAQAGVKRVNVSLDTLNRETFSRITRRDQLGQVLDGIEAAKQAGLRVKINVVALRDENLHEIGDIIGWAHGHGFDVTLIETMPLGEVDEDRTDQFVSLADVRAQLESYWRLDDVSDNTGGPSRYVRVAETGGRLGFITPLSHTFCASCNRVRLTCTGRLYLCLGQNEHIDFRGAMRAGASDDDLRTLLEHGIARKPEAHDFVIREPKAAPAVERHMSMTGG